MDPLVFQDPEDNTEDRIELYPRPFRICVAILLGMFLIIFIIPLYPLGVAALLWIERHEKLDREDLESIVLWPLYALAFLRDITRSY